MKTIKISDKEILVQLALGTFNISLLYLLVQETNNPVVLTAAAKTFVKLDTNTKYSLTTSILDTILNPANADNITTAFMNNKYTPPLVKSYVIVARQIKNLERGRTKLINNTYSSDWNQYHSTTQEQLKEKFEKIHQQLFDD